MVDTVDYQRVKLQELDTEMANDLDIDMTAISSNGISDTRSRVPRSFEVELRGNRFHFSSSDILDTCVAGDIVEVVGLMKSLQVLLLDYIFAFLMYILSWPGR
jgi:formyltetrahydrofolate synthetase